MVSCRLDPEGTAERPEPEVEDGPATAQHNARDASPTMPKPAASSVSTPDGALDAGGRRPVGEGGAPALDSAAPHAVGRDAAATGGESTHADAGVQTEPDPRACSIPGTYALQTEVDVAWDGSSVAGLALIAGGRGKVVMRAVTHLDGTPGQAILSPCHLTLPDFETAPGSVIGREVYGMDVPQSVWEGPSMPSWQTPWALSCNAPGCSIFSGMIEAVVGARVHSMPFAWPAAGGARDGFEVSDDDTDGLLGLTLITRGPDAPTERDQPYAYPPLVTSLLSRARAVQVAIGLRAQMQGTLESCSRYSGTLSFGGVYARTLGCTKQFGMRRDVPCDASDIQFLDDHLPIWRVLGGRFQAIRIETPTCEAVRVVSFTP